MGQLAALEESQIKFASVLFHEWYHTQQSQIGTAATFGRSIRSGDNSMVELPAWEAQARFLERAQSALAKSGDSHRAVIAGGLVEWAREESKAREMSATSRKILEGVYGLNPECRPEQDAKLRQVVDRGEGKGALMYSERQVIDAKTGDLLATLTSTSFLRGDGGLAGRAGR